MADLAADVAAVLRAMAMPPVHYVGLSLGGMVGQALALDHPALLRSVVICDALPESLPDAGAIWGRGSAPRGRRARSRRSPDTRWSAG